MLPAAAGRLAFPPEVVVEVKALACGGVGAVVESMEYLVMGTQVTFLNKSYSSSSNVPSTERKEDL